MRVGTSSTNGAMFNVERIHRATRAGFACPFCGNAVLREGRCPLRFPQPECLTTNDAASMGAEFRRKLEIATTNAERDIVRQIMADNTEPEEQP